MNGMNRPADSGWQLSWDEMSAEELVAVEGGIATDWVFDIRGGIRPPSLSFCRKDSDCWD